MRSSREQKVSLKAYKALLWTALAGLIFGLLGVGPLIDDVLRTARNSLHWHKASGDIILVNVDDQSIHDIGRWPWPRRRFGELADKLTEAGANEVLFDLQFEGRSAPEDDRLFAESLRRSGKVVLAAVVDAKRSGTAQPDVFPLPMFAREARVGTITTYYNYHNTVWKLPYALQSDGKAVPSFASILSGVHGAPNTFFIPDYSLDPKSVPTVSAANVLTGHFKPGMFKGKNVIIGTTTEAAGDQFFIPGTGRMGGVINHIIGAETLKSGKPFSGGWVPMFLIAVLVAGLAERLRRPVSQGILLGVTAATLMFGPTLLEAHLFFFDVGPALFVVLTCGGVLILRTYRQRGLINPVSNLPNLIALRGHSDGRKQALVAARVLNYEEIVATLPPNGERQLVEQIVARLNVGGAKRALYHGDGGIFAWFEEPRQPFANHLEALYSLFRNPARVAGLSLDLSISFGVEVGSGRSLANRLASALVAAEEAAHDGLKWKYHDPESLQDASWKLSMLSQLDEAIDRGEVWVAYQPKLDLATRKVIGAEALARWTHPQKGPIAASEFVAAAEQHNRIGKLTDYVLEKAVATAVQLNKRGGEFEMAVNLSAKLLTDKGFLLRLSALLARHGLPARLLTLELTETAALAGNGEGLDTIVRLRDLGVKIAIDDYGTGLSTLDYLKKIPAVEIKIDQSFVKGVVENRSDRLMVQSTISLAHSLGRKVVAEGVEHRDILDLLAEMNCDVAQGFAVGRPMSVESLIKRLSADRKRSAA